MSITIGPPTVDELRPRIAVIGIGGAGGNAIANMIAAHVEGVDFIVANTDAQALNSSTAEQRIQLGPDVTQGLGAGSRPEVGRAAAEETVGDIEAILEGTHMCFIAAGMGGGTGTGAAPVVAKAARDRGILTVGVVTKPFTFEGTRRMRAAEAGIAELQKNVDTLIVIPNQNLFLVANPNTTFKEAFQLADEVLQQGVRSITDLIVNPGLINLDFADIRSVMREMGKAMMGTGEAEGDGRALEAAERAIANPLLDGVSMKGAKGVIVSITGGDDMRLMEVDEAANHIKELVDPDANIIWGSAFNPALDGKIRVSVVATGIDGEALQNTEDTRPFSLAQGGTRSFTAPVAAPTPAPAPAPSFTPAPAPAPAPVAADHSDALDLGVVAQSLDDVDSASGGDELLLDNTSLDDDSTQAAEQPAPAPAPAPSAAPAAQAAQPATKAPRVATGGGTLFERMSSLSRGGARSDDDDDGDNGTDAPPLNIPRFLGRQNNQ
ncbi:MAG: cell division protein FtsZ [Blastomonas sp.]